MIYWTCFTIAVIVAVIILVVIFIKDGGLDGTEIFSVAFGCTLVFLVLCAISFVVSADYATKVETEIVEVSSYELKSMVLGSETNFQGSFFLIAGNFSSETAEEYKYMVLDESGLGFVIRTAKISEAKVNFVDEQPTLKIYETICKEDSALLRFLGIDVDQPVPGSKRIYQFNIPEDSIVETYDVNLNNLDGES